LGEIENHVQANEPMLDISVIIVNWNTSGLLAECLNSVNHYLRGFDVEVFVVDNGSSDDSVDMVRTNFLDVILIENRENVGFAKANNQAIRHSQGKYILLLNSDAFLLPDAIHKMVDVLEADQSIGIAGARLLFPDGRSQVSHGPLPTYWSETRSLFGLDKFSGGKVYRREYIETGTISGACMLIRKELLDRIGLLDEEFFMFNEEVDLCKRCHAAGSKVVSIQTATVIHVHAGSTGQTVQRIIRLYTAKLHYFYKHFGPTIENRLRRMMLIASIVKGAIYRMVRVISLGRIRKDDFWIAVSKELSSMY
jgi:GT2 family glycosyltransferase